MVGIDIDVKLLDGDIRKGAYKPEIIAYANTEFIRPPDGIIINTSGQIWRLKEWAALTAANSWIEARTHPTYALGVQFWGDTNDGLARVLVDDEEVWKGNTHGSDANWPGGAFVKYLKVTRVNRPIRKIRVECLGEGHVTILCFGFSVPVPSIPVPSIPVPSGMVLATCRRCGGVGKFSDPDPENPEQRTFCWGCMGDGKVLVYDPNLKCQRCGGTGVFTDQHQSAPAPIMNWCLSCNGTGYAR